MITTRGCSFSSSKDGLPVFFLFFALLRAAREKALSLSLSPPVRKRSADLSLVPPSFRLLERAMTEIREDDQLKGRNQQGEHTAREEPRVETKERIGFSVEYSNAPPFGGRGSSDLI